MRDSELFITRAAECRVQADAAELANVRERCLRAEVAWLAMANRSSRTEAARDAREMAAEAARNAAADSHRPDLITPDLVAVVRVD